MRKLSLSLAFAASAIAMAAVQANGSNSSAPDLVPAPYLKSCKVLLQKMKSSLAEDTWRNRLRTWQCRDDFSPDTAETAAFRKGLDQ